MELLMQRKIYQSSEGNSVRSVSVFFSVLFFSHFRFDSLSLYKRCISIIHKYHSASQDDIVNILNMTSVSPAKCIFTNISSEKDAHRIMRSTLLREYDIRSELLDMSCSILRDSGVPHASWEGFRGNSSWTHSVSDQFGEVRVFQTCACEPVVLTQD